MHRRFALAVRLRRDRMADGADAPTLLAWLMERGGGPGGATERRLPRGRGLWQHHHRQSSRRTREERWRRMSAIHPASSGRIRGAVLRGPTSPERDRDFLARIPFPSINERMVGKQNEAPQERAPLLLVFGVLAPRVASLIRARPTLVARLIVAPREAVHAVGAFLHLAPGAALPDAEVAATINDSDPRDLLRAALPGCPPRLYRALDRAGDTVRERALLRAARRGRPRPVRRGAARRRSAARRPQDRLLPGAGQDGPRRGVGPRRAAGGAAPRRSGRYRGRVPAGARRPARRRLPPAAEGRSGGGRAAPLARARPHSARPTRTSRSRRPTGWCGRAPNSSGSARRSRTASPRRNGRRTSTTSACSKGRAFT